MSARSIEELHVAVEAADRRGDIVELRLCAHEFDTLDTPLSRAFANHTRGLASFNEGDYAASIEMYERALAQHEALNNTQGIARATGNLGIVHARSGSYQQALTYFFLAREIHEREGDVNDIARTTSNIANTYQRIGDYPGALENYQRSLRTFREVGNTRGIAITITNMGNLFMRAGDYPAGLEHYQQALVLHKEVDHRYGVAIATEHIGIVYQSTGDNEKALENFLQALSLQKELGSRPGQAHVIANIGIVYRSIGDLPKALEHFHTSRSMQMEIGDSHGVANATANIIDAYTMLSDYENAEREMVKMDEKEIVEPQVVIMREMSRALLEERHGLLERADDTLRSALNVANKHELRGEEAKLLKRLRELCKVTGDFAGYVRYNDAYAALTDKINGKETATKLAMHEKQREIDAREVEHAKHMAVLHSTLPKHVAERVARGEVVNDTFDKAAVLFLDVVGFTTHTSAMEAGVVVGLLQSIFTTFDAICAEHNVMKIKTIGDSYMAVAFPSDGHVVKVATVACAMLAQVFVWPHTEESVEFRIGLHVGPVVAGVLGTERLQYDVWGDTVNVASRMESSGEAGRVHVSEAFALCLEEESRIKNQESSQRILEYRTVARGLIEIKGKGTMNTYWLESGL